MKAYVIGGANLDIFAKSERELILYDSNIAHFKLSFGGVGRNIAENLVYLIDNVELVTRFAKDHFAKILYDDCLLKGIKLDHALKSEDFATSMYIAILDANNDMQLGLNDMGIIETLKYDDIAFLKDIIKDDDLLVIDTNLASKTLTMILDEFKGFKVVDAISVNKVARLKGNLAKIDLLKCNKFEVESLFEVQLNDLAILKKILKDTAVPKELVITDKEGAFVYREGHLYTFRQKDLVDQVVNATGAGDAFIAIYAYCRKEQMSISKSVKLALSASRLTIKSPSSVVYKDRSMLEKEASKFELIEGEI